MWIVTSDELSDEPGVEIEVDRWGLPGALPVLRKWPTACRPDEDLVIGDDVYPAPARLNAREVLWWMDVMQMRAGASRNFINGATGALLGTLLASAAALGAVVVSATSWSAAVAASVPIGIVLAVGVLALKDSDHRPLEQRLLLYRQRARDLGCLGE
jgi:hypothetical protein